MLVTKPLPGDNWIKVLTAAGARVDVCQDREILDNQTIRRLIGDRCDAVIGQLTEVCVCWGGGTIGALIRIAVVGVAHVSILDSTAGLVR